MPQMPLMHVTHRLSIDTNRLVYTMKPTTLPNVGTKKM